MSPSGADRSFIRKYVFATDHVVVGKQYLWSGLLFLAFGGLLAMLIRWQLAYPGMPVPIVGRFLFTESNGAIDPLTYPKVFTTHGLVMIFFAVTPILIGGFGNALVPLQIGARDMAFPRMNSMSFWVTAFSQLLILSSFFAPLGTASAAWTSYPPLSSSVQTPGWGQSMVLVALFVNGIGTLMNSITLLTTVIRLRAPGMAWNRLPGHVWGQFFTAVLNVLFVPVLGTATMLLLLDRSVGTQFFVAGAATKGTGGDPLAYQHLFWIFGHPEVYILILPVWGLMIDLISFFSRTPAFGYRASIIAMGAITSLSGLVYGHHLFTSGMTPMLGQAFMLLTLCISLPALVLGLNWLQTLRRGSVQFKTPMLFALGTMIVFGIGGFTGLLLGDVSLDLYLHDTMFVVGHFHFTMAAATFLGLLAGFYFWFPRLFGSVLDERLGALHFVITLFGLVIVFSGQMLAGWMGQPRRLFDPYQYEFVSHLKALNIGTSHMAFTLGLAQLILVWNVVKTLRRGVPAPENPWQVGTLEWQSTSQDAVVVRGPHVFEAHPSGRDYWLQSEPLPKEGA